MNAIRMAITVFLAAILLLTGLGLVWMANSGNPQKMGGFVVLALGGIGALFALVELWKPRHDNVGQH